MVNILICGFMGSGKTTLVESFRGNSLGFKVYDLDHEVAGSLGISPNDLGAWIADQGLDNFRQNEVEVLNHIISKAGDKVIALGGGTLEARGFWSLAKIGPLVFLDTPFETCFSRIKNDQNRPLVQLGEAGLLDLYKKRLPLYKKADLILTENIVGLESLVHNLSNS